MADAIFDDSGALFDSELYNFNGELAGSIFTPEAVALIADAVWQRVLESGFTAENMMRIMAAALAGTSSKTGNIITFKGIDTTTDRIIGTFDNSNNRTGATLDGG